VPSTNATLAALSAEHPNTIVADWHAVVTADPTLLHSDRTHPNMRGIGAYADLLARTLDELGPR
jgi:lysophospholipase L1-like esterase